MSLQKSTDLLNEPDLTGSELGDYTILNRLGRGGMADVYLAQQKSLQRKVAIKILHQSLAEDPTYVDRFKNEAQAAAALTHPNIVRIYEVGTLENFHYISQEYIEGENLKQYLQKNKTVSVFMAATTLRQVAAALHKAKEQGVIHRDIKPENIMVFDGEVKVADFGLARINRNEASQELTKVGMTMGTPLYMSPEQAAGGQVDHRSDIYSLGVTAYHMLAGQPPFAKDNAIATAIAHKTETPIPLSTHRPEIPQTLVDIVEKMMEKEPADRYQDCGGIIKDLLGVSLDESQEEWSESFQTLSPAEAKALYTSHLDATRKLDEVIHGKKAQRSKAIWIGAGVLMILAFFGIGMLVASMNPPPPLIPPVAENTNPVPRQSSVGQQLDYARRIPNNQYALRLNALRAVKDYHPAVGDNVNGKLSKHRWAKFEIGKLHFQHNYYDLAEEIFSELAQLDPGEYLTFNLHGKAGLILVLHKRKELEGADVESLNREIEAYQVDVLTGMDRLDPELQEEMVGIFEEVTNNDESNL